MDTDQKVCYCFHISRRKLVNFVRREQPRVPSQLSECGGAGTGCGWCIPFLKQIFAQETRGTARLNVGQDSDPDRQDRNPDLRINLDQLSPEEYARRRADYIRAGKGKPPPGATPLPEEPDVPLNDLSTPSDKNY